MKAHVKGFDEAAAAADNLSEILKLVTESGCEIETVDPGFGRGLEYYTGMIFEVYIPELDIALGGGGRYDRLIEVFGGEPTPAVGVAHGLDRIALAMQMQKTAPSKRTKEKSGGSSRQGRNEKRGAENCAKAQGSRNIGGIRSDGSKNG